MLEVHGDCCMAMDWKMDVVFGYMIVVSYMVKLVQFGYGVKSSQLLLDLLLVSATAFRERRQFRLLLN